ncbi:MAG TPA: helix-turn-helix domain-containing protein [Candidatus Saccharimonadales bacterium]
MADYSKLHELGFSQTAALCYGALIESGTSSLSRVVENMQKPRASVHRALKQLEGKGFATSHKNSTYPTLYRAVPISQAIENLAVYHRRQLKQIIEEQAATAIRRKLK